MQYWLFLSTLCGLYFGIGSFVIVEFEQMKQIAEEQAKEPVNGPNGITFKNPASLSYYLQLQKAHLVFPWAKALPSFVNLAIGAAAFGLLGGAMRVVKELYIDQQDHQQYQVLITCVFGFFVGLMLLGISYVLPAALTRDTEIQIRPSTLLFLCFFGGLFSVRVFSWLETLVDRIFPNTQENENNPNGS